MLLRASGGVAAVQDDGSLEPVIVSSGQWFGMAELTRQMRDKLVPIDLTQRAFEMAGLG